MGDYQGGPDRGGETPCHCNPAPEVWRRKCGAEVDFWGLHRVAWEWAASLGRLSGTHECPADRADQQPGIRPVGVGETWRQMMAKGGRAGGQGGLRHDATCRRTGGGNRGRHPRNAGSLG